MGLRIVVVGGGIAGVSAAHFIGVIDPSADVVLVEAEAALAHHTTGRSAALLFENYGTPSTRGLTRASQPFLHDPPSDLSDTPVLSPLPMLHVANQGQDASIEAMLREGAKGSVPNVEISAGEAVVLFPPLRAELIHRAALEPETSDIDVAGLHQVFVRGFRRSGGRIMTSTRVDAIVSDGAGWTVETTTGDLAADVVVNAAGAWGDVVAVRAGVEPLGLEPLRRTAFMVNAPSGDKTGWAMAADVEHRWYVRPDGPQMLCSPADETPSEPCDARPDEIDVALAIDRINAATTLGIRSVSSEWAGLRTFAPDRSMVIGPDPETPAFIWCVGQGGTGIQSSPGAGRLTADLTVSGAPSAELADLDIAALLPDRLR